MGKVFPYKFPCSFDMFCFFFPGWKYLKYQMRVSILNSHDRQRETGTKNYERCSKLKIVKEGITLYLTCNIKIWLCETLRWGNAKISFIHHTCIILQNENLAKKNKSVFLFAAWSLWEFQWQLWNYEITNPYLNAFIWNNLRFCEMKWISF